MDSTTVITVCHNCHTPNSNLMWCSKCHAVKYCSKDCQRANWSNHKINCNKHLKPKVTIASEQIADLCKNMNLMMILGALMFHLSKSHTPSYLRCTVRKSFNQSQIPNAELFYKIEVEFAKFQPKKTYENRFTIEIIYKMDVNLTDDMADWVSFSVGLETLIAKTSFDTMRSEVNFDIINFDTKFEINASDTTFCAFSIGDKLINM